MSARRSRNGLRDPHGWPGGSGVEWWLLENGTVTPKASAGVSRDTSPSIPHGEALRGRRAKLPDRGRSDPERRLSDFMLHLIIGGVEVSMESLILAQDERWRRA